MPSLAERYRGCLLGLACGDAVGTAVEFRPRGSFVPVTDMVGGGPFGLNPGQWTDDTSMALCLAASLLDRKGFDPTDQMRRYVDWWRRGYLSSTGACFDIGATVRQALATFEGTGTAFAGSTDPRTAGNGSLMRLAPVALFFHPDLGNVIRRSGESSRTTHGAPEAVECCKLLGSLLSRALSGESRSALLGPGAFVSSEPQVADLAAGAFARKARSDIVGSGYAVASLEAALWCFHSTDRFDTAVLEATNLGDDADTTAAIVGQLAGAHYGAGAIPARWLERLFMRTEIEATADALLGASGR